MTAYGYTRTTTAATYRAAHQVIAAFCHGIGEEPRQYDERRLKTYGLLRQDYIAKNCSWVVETD